MEKKLHKSRWLFGESCELIPCLHLYKLKFSFWTILFCNYACPSKRIIYVCSEDISQNFESKFFGKEWTGGAGTEQPTSGVKC